jgi:hypothetical protein
LGFDAGIFLSDPYLWKLHGIRGPLLGFSPHRFLWPFLLVS